ncbi:hypothetical protein L226DRAFT_347040 [Lentinus tigrinus ALCF2SS1-7]|uniref:uncharacterized protein n=1 Tax=Lentinus tigrinus ALCF2SS1-7 TaxID=1328758 RepID=UPI001165EAC6|nr:hypothetical protein L226DRAFT_347040 [Lentinus tigrinus ALCF2SS1-7]
MREGGPAEPERQAPTVRLSVSSFSARPFSSQTSSLTDHPLASLLLLPISIVLSLCYPSRLQLNVAKARTHSQPASPPT